MDCKVDDEAFRKALAAVGSTRASMAHRVPVFALSASYELETKKRVIALLHLQQPVVVEGSAERPNIRVEVMDVADDTSYVDVEMLRMWVDDARECIRACDDRRPPKTIIFVNNHDIGVSVNEILRDEIGQYDHEGVCAHIATSVPSVM